MIHLSDHLPENLVNDQPMWSTYILYQSEHMAYQDHTKMVY